MRGLPKRTIEPSPMLLTDSSQTSSGEEDPNYLASLSLADISTQAEQRSQVSIYLLCRVLVEVYNQTDVVRLNPGLADKIEDIIFVQLKNTEPDLFSSFPFRQINWKIFGQLLGVMSSTNLRSVSQRFVNELRTYQHDLGIKGAIMGQVESKVEYLIKAMKHLHIRTQPEGLWRDSCDFLLTLGEFFLNSHGSEIKHAYCQTLEDLVMPIAARWGPQVNVQKFKDFLNRVNSRVSQMIVKPRHWPLAFRLSTVLLCASPTEYFAGQWLTVATSLQGKLKDRAARGYALQGICRLVWTYLDRVNDPSGSTIRKLDEVMKVVLPSGKKSYLSNDPTYSEPIIELIRIIGYRQQEFCFRTIIFPLISADLFSPGKDTKIEQLEPEKMVIGIRAFLAIMFDLEDAEHGRPPFPRFSSGGLAMDSRTVPGVPHSSQPSGTSRKIGDIERDQLSHPINMSKLGDSTRESFGRFCEIIGKITVMCDNAFGGQVVLDEKFGGLTPKTPLTESFTLGRRE